MSSEAPYGHAPGRVMHETSAVPEVERRGGSVGLPVRIAKAILFLASWGVFLWWLAMWFRLPTDEGKAFKKDVSTAVGKNAFWGKYATNYLLYVLPVIVLAILALLYLELEERFPERIRCPASGKQPLLVRLYRAIWTQPLLVKTLVGIITLIDVVIFVIVIACTVWVWSELLKSQFATIDAAKPKKGIPKWAQKWDKTSAMLGRALPFTISVLFVPVARGSPILRLIDVPFEQAVKYHRWFGYLTVLLVFIHGATYAVYLGSIDKLRLLVEWPYSGISNLAGTLGGIAAVIMGITSIPYVRSRHFNTFFTMHHLYIAFFVLYVFHVDWNHSGESMGPILLFFIDRFLRMVQSRRAVTGVSARILPSGLVELKIPRQSGFKYNALSFLYLNVPGISRLQWHPFSTTSTSLDDSEVSVCIKPLGDWTTNLHNSIAAQAASNAKATPGCPFAFQRIHAEGPYGHESNYFLRYKNLVLVAGGAGVTPFIAIIQDLLKRYELQHDGLPENIHLIWCVRRRSELATLRTVKPSQIYSRYLYQGAGKGGLTLNLQAFVTGEAIAGDLQPTETRMLELSATQFLESPQKGDVATQRGMSAVNSYQNLWMIALIVASMTGFVLMHALFYNYVSSPKFLSKGEKFSTALESILHLVCLFVGIVLCGGTVILFWISSGNRAQSAPSYDQETKAGQLNDVEGNDESDLLDSCVVSEGSRPQFEGLCSALTVVIILFFFLS
ncbi:hypothetical protein KC19_5G161700 [Ceratodon purpureus]|uniref:FAD-binding FR-type domain-containing protein n=1 Tax=Ceratodon purpureus TaxID=3225 RepID=A0A8T0I4N2_CERPU|nr:hypothetical protein KC19_5G161700 [Ceratodon purpureus]